MRLAGIEAHGHYGQPLPTALCLPLRRVGIARRDPKHL